QLYARDCAQHLAWRLADTLRMREVAGVLIGDPQRHRMPGHPWRPELADQLGHILDTCGKSLRPFGPLSIATQQVPVLLHRRSTTRGADGNAIDSCALEALDGAPGECARFIQAPRMQRKRSTTTLVTWNQHVTSLTRQHAHRRLVHFGKNHALDTPGKDAHT